jgi:Ca2+-binding RTX toxin-like protein
MALLASTLLCPDGAASATNDPCLGGSTIQVPPGGATVVGTPQDDVMTGSSGNDQFWGMACDDHLLGKEGNDILTGYWGDDKLEGGDGFDMLYGEWGDDVLLGGDDLTTDYLYGGPGNDYLSAGQGNGASMWGEQGIDTYVGASNYADDFYVHGSPDRGTTTAPALRTSDVIENFEAIDRILLHGTYTLTNPTMTPGEGQYSIYPELGGYVVTWNSPTDEGYHDVVVKGGNPNGRVFFYP